MYLIELPESLFKVVNSSVAARNGIANPPSVLEVLTCILLAAEAVPVKEPVNDPISLVFATEESFTIFLVESVLLKGLKPKKAVPLPSLNKDDWLTNTIGRVSLLPVPTT